MASRLSPRRAAAVELVRSQVTSENAQWLRFWNRSGTRWPMSRLLHRAINLLPVVGFAALWVLDSALIAGVTLFGAALTVFAFDARTKHDYQSATINRMLDSVPGLEETVLAGVKVDADVLFQFKLGGPPADISVQTLRRQLTQLGSDGLDLAAAASASGWADASAAAAVEKVLSVPSYAQWWETKLAAPGFDVFLQELAARRVNDDAGKCHYLSFAHGGDIAEDFNRADLDDAFPQMPLTTKVALATGAALDPNWFPKMYSLVGVELGAANQSLQRLSRREHREQVARLMETARQGDGVTSGAANSLLEAEFAGAEIDDLALAVLLEGDRSPQTEKFVQDGKSTA